MWRPVRSVLLPFAVAAALSGCATSEYIAEKYACRTEWYEKMPPNIVTRMVTRHKIVKEKIGERCEWTQEYDLDKRKTVSHRKCVDKIRETQRPYTDWVQVDLNEDLRDDRIEACAVQACVALYGNPKCEAVPSPEIR
ncbi:MAG: hypothetical protein GDA39_01270 [Hyphomonadaceae bacterium]|nr:hypothetical protein [Hyphomonadaceae bacterium]MBC6411630.1 hypothetical protein [Hyphomonadaceae bacterium]